MGGIKLIPLVDGGLGKSAYLLDRDREVGYDQIAGELDGGIAAWTAAWTAAGEPTGSIPVAGVEALDGATVLDIRQDNAYDAGHVPGAYHIELGALAARADDLPNEPLANALEVGQ